MLNSMQSHDYVNTDVWDIVNNIEREINEFLNDVKQVSEDDVLDVVDAHYPKIIDSVVYQMSCLPVDRVSKGLEPLLPQDEVNKPFNEIVNMISTVFGKPAGEISKEILYRDWETDRKSTRLNSSHSAKSRMPSSA